MGVSRYGIFCEVVSSRNFTKAAQRLGYTQGAVSQSVKALEREVGTTLLDRSNSMLALTPDGEELYPFIAAVHNAERDLEARCHELHDLEGGVVRIGAGTSISRTVIPPILRDFKAKHPHIHVELRQGVYDDVAEWVADGTIHFGFTIMEAPSEFPRVPLFEDELMAVLPRDHRLAEQAFVSLEELAPLSQILIHEGSFSLPLALYSAYGLEPNIEYRVEDDYSILAMVEQGLAASLMYDIVIRGLDQGVSVRHIREAPRRTHAMVWKSYDTMPLAARMLSDHVRSVLAGETRR